MRKKIVISIIAIITIIMLICTNLKILAVEKVQAEDVEYNYSNANSSYSKTIYVPNDTQNDYFIEGTEDGQYYEVYKHNIKNNTNTLIYKSKTTYRMVSTYTMGNIIYIEEATNTAYESGNLSQVSMIGYDVVANKVIYEGTFNLGSVRKSGQIKDYFPSFAVDSKQRFYFVYDFTGMKVFDNKGTVLYTKVPQALRNSGIQDEVIIRGITPNDEGILIAIGTYTMPPYGYFETDHIGFQRLNSNGTFVKADYTWFTKEETASYINDPNWKFIPGKTNYAVNQYGEIAKFTYTTDGVKIEQVDDALREIYDYHTGYLYNAVHFIKGNYLYLLGARNYVFVYDINKNFERVGRINTQIPESENEMKEQISRITIIDDCLYIRYKETTESDVQERKISVDAMEGFENIWNTKHSTQKNTQAQIIEKCKAALPKYDYTKNQFTTNPSYRSPYVAGKLQNQVVTDTINQINYYRWLYGVNEITVYSEKLERNQKGAVLQAANNEISQNPSKPSNMNDDFYNEACIVAKGSTVQGDAYNASISKGNKSAAHSIESFISELNDTSTNGINNRLNVLDIGVNKASFGYCNGYTTLSMYYEEVNNNDKFYAYPAAGNFPMQNFVTDEYWHLYFTEKHILKNMRIQFTYNNKTYTQNQYSVEGDAIVFKMPDGLIKVFGGSGKTMSSGKITVQITGLTNVIGDTVNYKYDVNFFDTGIEQTPKYTIADVNNDGKINSLDAVKILQYVAKKSKLTEAQMLAADTNKDGKVNSLDAVKILQYVAKKITKF